MATAVEVARKSLKRILVEADEAPLEDTEYADFYEVMNDFMADLEASNVNLGYSPVSSSTDVVTVPRGALKGIITNCAIEASPDYGGYVSPALQQSAKAGMLTLRRLGSMEIKSKLPTTLPMGSGNEQFTYSREDYYRGQNACLATLAGSTEATTITTMDVSVQVAGYWRVEYSKGLFVDIDGIVRNTTGLELTVDADIDMYATGNSTYTFKLLRNDTHEEVSTAKAVTSTPTLVSLDASVTLGPGEYLSIWVEDDAATEDVTIVDAQFEVS